MEKEEREMEVEENTSKERIGCKQKPKKEDRYRKENKEQHEKDEQRWTQMLQVICMARRGQNNTYNGRWEEEGGRFRVVAQGSRNQET